MAIVFHKQPRVERHDPTVVRYNRAPFTTKFLYNCLNPVVKWSAVLGSARAFIVIVTPQEGCGNSIPHEILSVVALFFMHGPVGLKLPHRWRIMIFFTLSRRSPPHKLSGGTRAHTLLSTSCNHCGPFPLKLRTAWGLPRR